MSSTSTQQLFLVWRHGWGPTSNPANWQLATADTAYQALRDEFARQWKPTRRFDAGDDFRQRVTATWWEYLVSDRWPGGIQVAGLKLKLLEIDPNPPPGG